MWERCGYHYAHHPVTLAPMGRRCEQAAVEALHWKDGRTSVACHKHGVVSLVPEARLLLKRVVPLISRTVAPRHEGKGAEMAEFVYRYCRTCHAELKTREQVRGLCAACRRVAPLVCKFCGKPATCVGRYEMATHDEPACDECCGHACEDGLCVTVRAYEAAGRNWRRVVKMPRGGLACEDCGRFKPGCAEGCGAAARVGA